MRRPAKKQAMSLLPRLAHPVADRIAQAINKNRAEDQRKCLGAFTRAVREIVESFDKHQDEGKKSELVRALEVGCVSVVAAATIGWRTSFEEFQQIERIEQLLDENNDILGKMVRHQRTAKGRAKRSANTQAGRDLVYKCLDSLFKKKPDWLNGAGITDNRIKNEILPVIEKELKVWQAAGIPNAPARGQHDSQLRQRLSEAKQTRLIARLYSPATKAAALYSAATFLISTSAILRFPPMRRTTPHREQDKCRKWLRASRRWRYSQTFQTTPS